MHISYLLNPQLTTVSDYKKQIVDAINNNRTAEAMQLAERFIKTESTNFVKYECLSFLYLVSGNEKYFHEISKLKFFETIRHFNLSIFSPTFEKKSNYLPIFIYNPPKPYHQKVSNVFIVCANFEYFTRFIEMQIESLAKTYSNFFYVVGCVDFTSEQYEHAFRVLSQKKHVILIPIETRLKFSKPSYKAFLTTARWLISIEIMKKFPHADEFQFLDIDMTSEQQTVNLMHPTKDIGLIFYSQQIFNAMSVISGSLVIVKNSNTGLQFCTQIKNHCESLISNGACYWHVDQVALLKAKNNLQMGTLQLLPESAVESPAIQDNRNRDPSGVYYRSVTASTIKI